MDSSRLRILIQEELQQIIRIQHLLYVLYFLIVHFLNLKFS